MGNEPSLGGPWPCASDDRYRRKRAACSAPDFMRRPMHYMSHFPATLVLQALDLEKARIHIFRETLLG